MRCSWAIRLPRVGRKTQPDFFSGGIVGRGISAQTTPQMVVRMHADVIALKPRVVHIMAGTNDIASNTGPMTRAGLAEQSHGDVRDRAGAQASRWCSRPFRRRPVSVEAGARNGERHHRDERMDSRYAKQTGATYADYHGAMSNGKGGMKAGLSSDEVHPDRRRVCGDEAHCRRPQSARPAACNLRSARHYCPMATGWAQDGAVQDQIDATVKDGSSARRAGCRAGLRSNRARIAAPEFPRHDARRFPGVRLCVTCQEAEDREAVHNAGYNRRGSKDSQLR